MNRWTIALGLTSIVVLGVGHPSVALAPNPNPPKTHLAETLTRPVAFNGFADPKMTLEEALEILAKRFDFSFRINERAFMYENMIEVRKSEIANPDALPPMQASLEEVLQKLLSKLAVPSGATYLVRDSHIEITTTTFARREIYGANFQGVLFPFVSAVFEDQPLTSVLETLGSRSKMSVILDPTQVNPEKKITAKFLNVPIDTALLLVADMHGLVVVPRHNVFYLTTKAKADQLRSNMEEHDKRVTRPSEPIEPDVEDGLGGLPGIM